ncbi:hypothetical protein D5S17_12255 [Pseudonocardiaceae bacterium YIM PH 21723]|nr:hypothetical protein D5S17_12255 [Pseudonocardiaceae bacterium YIM PH 21723]
MRLNWVLGGQEKPAARADVLRHRLGGRRTAPETTVIDQLRAHRPEFFGTGFACLWHEVMHGDSEWSPAERQLLAATVSKVNGSMVCLLAHQSAATRELGPGLVTAALRDPGTAPITPPLAAALRFVAKLAGEKADVQGTDAGTIMAWGRSADAVRDLAYLCAVVTTINRITDALDLKGPFTVV